MRKKTRFLNFLITIYLLIKFYNIPLRNQYNNEENMNIKVKKIGMLFFLVLIILLILQGVWIFSTYYVLRKDVGNKINILLVESIEMEVGLRFIHANEKHKEIYRQTGKSDTVVFEHKFEINNIFEENLSTQQKHSIQKFLDKDGFPFEQAALENILRNKLKKEKISTSCSILYKDSTEIVMNNDNSIFRKTFFSDSYQIIDENRVQAIVEIPVPTVLKSSIYIFAVSFSFMMILMLFMIYLFRVIISQDSLLRLRDDFTNALNHNMRTPLNSIQIAIDNWRRGYWDDNPEMRNNVIRVAFKQVEKLLSIVDTLLSISLYERKKIVLDKKALNLPDIIDWIKEKHSLNSDKKSLNISTDYDIKEQVIADEVHLISIIDNLIDNAIKYSGNSVEINISCHTKSGRLYIKVKDNGYGISKKAKSHIFDKYERGDAVKRKEATGVGLGLCYVKNLVKAHGGTIKVDSTVGVGSEFIIEIPVE